MKYLCTISWVSQDHHQTEEVELDFYPTDIWAVAAGSRFHRNGWKIRKWTCSRVGAA